VDFLRFIEIFLIYKRSYHIAMYSKRVITVVVATILFFTFILLTNPREISLAAILVPFALLGVIFYNILIFIIERFFKKSAKKKKIKILGLVGTIILVNFTLLSSIGQLTPQDTILAILITVLGGFYLYKFQIS